MAQPTTDEEQPKFSEKFSSNDAEVTFKSIDNILFKIHAINLKAYTDGFSPPEGTTFAEIAQLTEPASVLELLFQFIYPRSHPDVESLAFQILESLAEAAEKYQVYPAMAICRIYMFKALHQDPLAVFAYALKHDYCNNSQVMGQLAPLMLDIPSAKIFEKIPSEFIVPWVLYRDRWLEVSRNALADFPVKPRSSIPLTIIHGLKIFSELETIPTNFGTLSWRYKVEKSAKAIPTFDKFLPSSSAPPKQDVKHVMLGGNAYKASQNFFHDDGDVTLKSSDNFLFRLHSVILKAAMATIPITNDSNEGSEIQLPETSETLELLFHFIYPFRQPDLKSLDVNAVKSLANAAEGYSVYMAMYTCKIFMKDMLPANADWIFTYAAKGGYCDVMDIAAPLVVDRPLKEIIAGLPHQFIIPWIQYHDHWNQVVRKAITFFSSSNNPCHSCHEVHEHLCKGCGHLASMMPRSRMVIMSRLGEGISSLRNLQATFDHSWSSCCSNLKDEVASWRRSVEEDINEIPLFSTLLDSR